LRRSGVSASQESAGCARSALSAFSYFATSTGSL
jgi:hypothetical protein